MTAPKQSAIGIVGVSVQPYALPFAIPVRTARGVFVRRRGWHLTLRCADGRRGWGDVAPWPGFGTDEPTCAASLEALAATWAPRPWPQVAELEAAVAELPVEVAHGLTSAHADVCAQRRGVGLAEYLAAGASSAVAVHAQVATALQAQEAVRAGIEALKVKVGIAPLADEVTRLVALRASVGPGIALRLDANGAWPVPVAVRAARLLAMVSPAWLEQPVAANDIAGLAEVRRLGGVPIAADESVVDADALRRLLAAAAVDVVTLKPMFVGGPYAAVALGRQAEAAGCMAVVTHSFDSVVGRMGALHVAAALRCRVPCGLQSPFPAANEVAAGSVAIAGVMAVPEVPGLGLETAAISYTAVAP